MTICKNPHIKTTMVADDFGNYYWNDSPKQFYTMFKVQKQSFHTPVLVKAQDTYDCLMRMRYEWLARNPDAENVINWQGSVCNVCDVKDNKLLPPHGFIGEASITTGRPRRRPTK